MAFNRRKSVAEPAPAARVEEQPKPATNHAIPPEKIAKRAYEKWEKRGRPDNSSERDWLEAEAELRAEQERSDPRSTRKSR
jgi:hypothetical protein